MMMGVAEARVRAPKRMVERNRRMVDCCSRVDECVVLVWRRERRGSWGLYSGLLERCGEKCGGVKPLRLFFTER